MSSRYISDVRKTKPHPLGCGSCFATSCFSEHPKNERLFKPHTLVCGGASFF
jgi:hypothetical protein